VPQHIFQHTIYTFSVTITLWVECSAHAMLNTHLGHKGLPKFAREANISICDNGAQHTMICHNLSNKNISQLLCTQMLLLMRAAAAGDVEAGALLLLRAAAATLFLPAAAAAALQLLLAAAAAALLLPALLADAATPCCCRRFISRPMLRLIFLPLCRKTVGSVRSTLLKL
jgi:hypothetical protein